MAPTSHPNILVVSLPGNVELVAAALASDATIHCARDAATALKLSARYEPDVVLVGYHFDEMRPYRVIRALREDVSAVKSVVILFCMLPTKDLTLDASGIRESYKSLGCAEFLDLRTEATEHGLDAALRKLREGVVPFLGEPRQRESR